MTRYSYHASHEQFSPRVLLQLAGQAEAAGFDGVFCSDHLQPWAPSQGHSGFTWSWLGSALQATTRLSFSTITVPGGWRYHPVVLAQAIGTLCEMYPARLPWLAFGSGEAINEQVTGQPWPPKAERNARLRDGVVAIRALLAGERITCGESVKVADARIWELPVQPPRLFGAATSEATARWLGGWADGLLTLGRDLGQLERLVAAFREGGGEGKPVHAKLDVSWADSDEEALQQAHRQWRFSCIGGEACWDLRQPEDFERATRYMRPEDLHAHVLVASDLGRHIEHLHACAELGIEAIDIHQVGLPQRAFIDAYGATVLPALHG